MHHFLEDHGVYILAEHVKEEPVANEGLLDDGVDDFPSDESKSDVEQVGTHFRAEYNYQSIQNNQHTEDRQQNKPERKGKI